MTSQNDLQRRKRNPIYRGYFVFFTIISICDSWFLQIATFVIKSLILIVINIYLFEFIKIKNKNNGFLLIYYT